jgi:hypothetical protein
VHAPGALAGIAVRGAARARGGAQIAQQPLAQAQQGGTRALVQSGGAFKRTTRRGRRLLGEARGQRVPLGRQRAQVLDAAVSGELELALGEFEDRCVGVAGSSHGVHR